MAVAMAFRALYGLSARVDEKKPRRRRRRLQENRNPINQIVHPPGYAGAMLVAIWRGEDACKADCPARCRLRGLPPRRRRYGGP